MLLNIFQANMKTFMQLEFSPTVSTIIYLAGLVVRTVLTLVIINPYNTNIAQIACDIVIVACFIVPRFKYFKLDKSGVLCRKINKK